MFFYLLGYTFFSFCHINCVVHFIGNWEDIIIVSLLNTSFICLLLLLVDLIFYIPTFSSKFKDVFTVFRSTLFNVTICIHDYLDKLVGWYVLMMRSRIAKQILRVYVQKKVSLQQMSYHREVQWDLFKQEQLHSGLMYIEWNCGSCCSTILERWHATYLSMRYDHLVVQFLSCLNMRHY